MASVKVAAGATVQDIVSFLGFFYTNLLTLVVHVGVQFVGFLLTTITAISGASIDVHL